MANDHDGDAHEQGPPEDGGRTGAPGGGVGRVLRARMPVWLAALLVLVTAIAFTIALVTRDTVDLGPAIDGATDARVSLTICNEIVDERDINPRAAELQFAEALRDLGARNVDVVIDRIDCGPSVTAPEPPR